MWHVWEAGQMHVRFWSVSFIERHHLEVLGVGGKILLKFIFKMCNGEAWTHLAQYWDVWRAIVNAVINFQVSIK